MIEFVGVDVIEVDRIERAMRDPRFLSRILTEKEIADATTPIRVAGRWAAKEALAKCIPGLTRWHDAEVMPDESGRPRATVRPDLLKGRRVHLSITHERRLAVAVAVLESVPES